MTQQHSIELNQAICTIALAHIEAAKFPGLSIQPWDTKEWTYDVHHSVDPAYDRVDVSLDDLVVEVKNVVAELQSRFGENAERLGDLKLNIRINVPPADGEKAVI